MERKTFFYSKDGIRLCGLVSRGEHCKAILMCHGIRSNMDECGAFTALSDALRQAGYTTLRMDFRGQGESGGEDSGVTISGEVMDVEAALDFLVSKRYKDIIVVGASLGAAVVSMVDYKKYPEVKALVMWYGALDFNELKKGSIFSAENRSEASEYGYCSTFSFSGVPFRIGMELFEEIDRIDPMKNLPKIELPVLFVHGSDDEAVPCSVSVEACKKCEQGRVSIIEGGRHSFVGDERTLKRAVEETAAFIGEIFE